MSMQFFLSIKSISG